MAGKVIKVHKNNYEVLVDSNVFLCTTTGLLKYNKQNIIVGDNVLINNDNQIISVKKRNNYLLRPRVANVDKAIVVTSLKEPNLDIVLLDKLLVILEFNSIKPIICLTKKDLLNETEIKKIDLIFDYYKKIGYTVLINSELKKIKSLFKNSTIVLTGPSGSGKSTLINKITNDYNLKTNSISKALKRGRHTTTSSSLLTLCEGYVIDTPGFTALETNELTKEDIKHNFIEFHEMSIDCKYTSCMHVDKNVCNVLQNLDKGNILQSRYNNYIKFIENKR
ncbi:MAG: ribosome small subunit-dependent GTPase A [Bacilli bacterium]